MTSDTPAALPAHLVAKAVEAALAEDLGLAGDITTAATVRVDERAEAVIAARRQGVISGVGVAEAAFRTLDPAVSFSVLVPDGEVAAAGQAVARISGRARALLSAERVALNFMGRMGGIATLTRAYVDRIAGTGAAITDTRKTTPGLRAFEKYAVRCGGGRSHRTGLFDAVLIKDNHIIAAGGLAPAITAARDAVGHLVKIEVEVDTLDQLAEALRHPIDAVLLDNMTPEELRDAVQLAKGKVVIEASGGVSLATVREVAEAGVDLISVGSLTHSAPVLDLGLDFAAIEGADPAKRRRRS